MQLALLTLAVVFVGSAIGWIGRPALAQRAFALYASLFLNPIQSQQQALQRQLRASKSELRATSRQDQFAEWSKKRKQVDKGMLDLQATNAALASHRARFDQAFTAVFYAVTSGLQWGIVWWFRRQPVIWIPAGWMPNSVASLLSIGGAPKGAVSVTVWSVVCKRVIDMFRESFMQWLAGPVMAYAATWRAEKQPDLVPELD